MQPQGTHYPQLFNLQGNIKELYITKFRYDREDTTKALISSNKIASDSKKYYFDEYKKIKKVESSFNDKLKPGIINIYDDFKTQIPIETTVYHKDTLFSFTSRLYDDNGVMIEEIRNNKITRKLNRFKEQNDTIYYGTEEYVDKYFEGRIIESYNSETTEQTSYFYDKKDNLIEKIKSVSSQPTESTKYNKYGDIVEKRQYSYKEGEDVVIAVNTYCYDKNRRKKIHLEHGIPNDRAYYFITSFIYNNSDQLIRWETTGNSRVYPESKYEYNENGDLIKDCYHSKTEEHKYLKFDENNNWIERKIYIDGVLFSKTIREIKYY